MDWSLRFLHGAYAVAIAIFLPFVVAHSLKLLTISGPVFFGMMVICGLIAVGLSLFRYSLGLGLGLMLGGIRCVIVGSIPYWDKINEGFRFVAAFGVLLLVLYAWYRMSKNNKGK